MVASAILDQRLEAVAEVTASVVEAMGVAIIGLVAVFSLGYFLFKAAGRCPVGEVYRSARQVLGRGILLGLEFLVAADIIHTVAVELTFRTVGVLAIIVVIRTFLSWSLELELTGRWPWQGSGEAEK